MKKGFTYTWIDGYGIWLNASEVYECPKEAILKAVHSLHITNGVGPPGDYRSNPPRPPGERLEGPLENGFCLHILDHQDRLIASIYPVTLVPK